MTATSGLNRCRLRLSGSVAGATLVRARPGHPYLPWPHSAGCWPTARNAGPGCTGSLSGSWDTLARNSFWENLSSAALTGQRSAFSSRRSLPAKEEREAFLRLAAVAPDHVAHSRTVTALALRLFDDLAPLHGLSRRDRTLLSYAATVHDIGWIHGQAGHQKESAGMILASPSLPVPVREQGIIALAAGLHGGKMQARPDGLFTLLVPADQKRVRTLAALLRVADGLDYLHAGSVSGLHCTIRATEVLCTLTGTGDTATEKARATRKSDLFTEVFGKTLVIA